MAIYEKDGVTYATDNEAIARALINSGFTPVKEAEKKPAEKRATAKAKAEKTE